LKHVENALDLLLQANHLSGDSEQQLQAYIMLLGAARQEAQLLLDEKTDLIDTDKLDRALAHLNDDIRAEAMRFVCLSPQVNLLDLVQT
jgi:hypothetical protein